MICPPFFAGEIPEGSFAHWSIDDSFWDGGFAAGDYRCVLVHPENFLSMICPGAGRPGILRSLPMLRHDFTVTSREKATA